MLHKLAEAATAGVEKTRIRANALKLGMYVAALDRPWIDSPFLVHGFTVRKHQQLEELQQLCQFVYIDITRGSASSDSHHGSKPKQTTRYSNSASFAENLPAARAAHAKAKVAVAQMFDQFSRSLPFAVEPMRLAVRGCVENIIANPDALLWLSSIKDKDAYTVEHSVNVALLSISLGRVEGLMPEDLEDLGICAMLHDIGKTKIPAEILNKEGDLDEQEFEVMKMHTIHGKKLLLGTDNIPDAAVDIALSHHEQLDGSGYPVGLDGSRIPYLVRIVAIADAYDAMTSGRIYSDAKPAAEALKLLLETKDTRYDSGLLTNFIEYLGIYPIGSVAELSSGEAGIVLPVTDNNRLQPRIWVARDANKAPCQGHVIDTSSARRPDNKRPYLIRALHPDGTFGLKLADFHQYELQNHL